MTNIHIPNSRPSRKSWYVVGLGAATLFISFAVPVACMPVLFSEIAEELKLSITQVGTIWGSSSIAGIFSIMVAGIAADHFGPKRTVLVGCFMVGIFGAARGLTDSFTGLVITSLLFGLASEAVPVIVVKNTSLWFHGRSLGTSQGIITTGAGAGLMLGALFSATILSPLLGGWNNVLFLYGGLSVLLGLVWMLTVPEPQRTDDTGIKVLPAPGRALSHLFRIKGLWLIAIAMMGFAGCNKGVAGYLPLYLRNNGWTAARADGAFAALSAAGTVAAIPLTLLSDRLGLRKAVLLPGLVFTIVGTGMLSIVTGQMVWVLAMMIGVFRDMVWAISATMTVETKGIGLDYAGTAVGIVHAFTRIGYAITPPIGNSLETIQPGVAFVFWAGFSIMALVLFSFVKETGVGGKRSHAVK